MYYPKDEALGKLLEKIEECKELLPKVIELSDFIRDLRIETEVGELIPFNKRQVDSIIFSHGIDEMRSIIDLEEIVSFIKEMPDRDDVEFSVGEIIRANQDIRTINRELGGRDLDVRGTRNYYTDEKFVILDIDGVNCTLLKYTGYGYDNKLLFAKLDQLRVFFDKTEKEENINWIKIEFTLNGPNMKFAKDLSEIRLFGENAYERSDNSWGFANNHSHKTELINLTADEIFGMMGTAYFMGEVQPNYLDIFFKFDDKFATGFSQSKQSEEMYKYNGKISYFTKEKGKFGDTFFPKDVFSGTQKERIANIVEIKQIIKYKEEDPNRSLSEGRAL